MAIFFTCLVSGAMPGLCSRASRVVRIFAHLGGSPTGVDVRVASIAMPAGEIAAGIPQTDQKSRWWLWAFVPATGSVLFFWLWRALRRRSADEGEMAWLQAPV